MMLCNRTLTESSSQQLSDLLLNNMFMLLFILLSSKQERVHYAEVSFMRSTFVGFGIFWDV